MRSVSDTHRRSSFIGWKVSAPRNDKFVALQSDNTVVQFKNNGASHGENFSGADTRARRYVWT